MFEIPLLIALMAGAVAIPILSERQTAAARRRVGAGAVSINTMKDGTRLTLRTLAVAGLASMLLLLAATMWKAFNGLIEPDRVFDAVVDSAQTFFLTGMAFYILWNYGRFHIGPNGIAEQRLSWKSLGGNKAGMVPWERIQRLEWDRDVGQLSWGLTFHFLGENAREYKIRIYVPRPHKEALERIIRKAMPSEMEPVAGPSNGIGRRIGTRS